MDYSDFDYKTACKILSMRELEILLFKSRCSRILTLIKTAWKNARPKNPFSFVVVGIIAVFYMSFSFLYAFFDKIFYLLTHKEKDKSVVRYSEIKWDKSSAGQTTGEDDGDITTDDVREKTEEKTVEECPQENHAEDICENNNVGEIIKEHKENAEKELKMALQIDNDDFKKYFFCGRAQCCIGDYKEAVENMEIACELNNNDAWSFYWCGSAYYELKNYKKTIEKLERACELDNNEYDFFYLCGKVYYENENYIKAIEKLERACEMDNSDFSCFHWCGEAYLRIGDNEKAFEKFDRNIKSE